MVRPYIGRSCLSVSTSGSGNSNVNDDAAVVACDGAANGRTAGERPGRPARGRRPARRTAALFWEKQLIAVVNLLSARLDITLDEFRRAVEEMPPEEYAQSYLYGRRLDGWLRLLVERGTIDAEQHRKRTQQILISGSRDHVS